MSDNRDAFNYMLRVGDPFGYTLRNMGRGMLGLAAVPPSLAALAGSESGAAAARGINELADSVTGVSGDVDWRDDPLAFVAQNVGGALVGPWGRGAAAIEATLNTAPRVVQPVLRGLEAITPATIPLTPRYVAANAGVGTVAGVGVQELLREEFPVVPLEEIIPAAPAAPAAEPTAPMTTEAVQTPEPTEPVVLEEFPVVSAEAPEAAPRVLQEFPVVTAPPPIRGGSDLAARILHSEAASEGRIGKAAAAAVMVNRARASGMSLDEVATRPYQFEPWNTQEGRARARSYTPAQYAEAREILEGVANGTIPDPTNGATHFLNPELQVRLGRPIPSWAPPGQGTRIGRHVFYSYPQEFANRSPARGTPQVPRVIEEFPVVTAEAPQPVGEVQLLSAEAPRVLEEFPVVPATNDATPAPERTWGQAVTDNLGTGMLALTGAAFGGAALRNVLRQREATSIIQNAPDRPTQPGYEPPTQAATPGVTESTLNETVNDTTILRNRVQEEVDAGRVTPEQGAFLDGLAERNLREMPRQAMADDAMRSGVLPTTGNRSNVFIRPMQEVVDEFVSLTPIQRQNLMDGLNAANELNNRKYNRERGILNPNTGGGQPVNMWRNDDADLHRRVGSMNYDPETQRFAQMYQQRNAQLRQYMVDEGLITRQEAHKLAAVHPDYVHQLIAGDTNNPLTGRDYTPYGGALRMQDPIAAMQEAERTIVSFALENAARRELLRALAQPKPGSMGHNSQNMPNLIGQRFVGRIMNESVAARQAKPSGFEYVKFRENGQRMVAEVIPPIAATLNTAPRATVPLLSSSARLFQHFTTGARALIGGTVFAPVSMGMSSLATVVNKPRGMRAGLVDAAIGKITGGRVTFGDPTFIANSLVEVGLGAVADSSREIANFLRRSALNDGVIARTLGPMRVNDAINAFQRYYDGSLVAMARREGVLGTGSNRLVDIPSSQSDFSRTLGGQMRGLSPEYPIAAPNMMTWRDVRGSIGQQGFLSKLNTYITSLGSTATPASVRRVASIGNQMLDITASAHALALMRQNRGAFRGTPHGDMRLATAARRVAGDPTQYGSSKAVQQVTSVSPYLNVTLQALNAYGRAFKRDPWGTTLALTTATGIPVMLSWISAMEADEELRRRGEPERHVAYKMNQSPREAVTGFTLHHADVPPELSPRLPFDPTTAPVVAGMDALFPRLIGADQPTFFDATNAPMRDSLRQFFTNRLWNNVPAGLEAMGFQISPPPVAAAIAQVGGVDIGRAFSLNPRISMPRDVGAPGYTETRYLNDPVNRIVEAIVTTTLGAGGAGIIEMARAAGMTGQYSPLDQPIREQYRLNMETTGAGRMVAPLFQGTRRVTISDQIGETLRPIDNNIQRITQGITDVTQPGTVGSGRYMAMAPGAGRPGGTTDMTGLLQHVARFNTMELAPIRAERNTLFQEMNSLQSGRDPNSGTTGLRADPRLMREEVNSRAQQIRQLNMRMYQAVRDFENQLAVQSGRRIDLGKIDPTRGMDQFPQIGGGR